MGFGRGRWRLLITRFSLWWPAFLAVPYRDQRGWGMGLSPVGEGRREGRAEGGREGRLS